MCFSMLSAVGVIPARYGSRRLPGKPLADLQGKPLLYYVYQRAAKARTLDEVWIATDDDRIFNAAQKFGARVLMTSGRHRCGTDRIAEAASGMDSAIIVNIQGDEPLMDSALVDQTVRLLQEDPGADISTLKSTIDKPEDLLSPNVVKVVTDENGYALYFSRSIIPYVRLHEDRAEDLRKQIRKKPELLANFHRHVGIYAYRREFLLGFAEWAPSRLEILEDLEQLRALEHGAKIRVGSSEIVMHGIDTPEDLERIRSLVGKNPEILNV